MNFEKMMVQMLAEQRVEARLAWLKHAQAKMMLDITLDDKERFLLASLLGTLLDGYKINLEKLGITPKRGPQPEISLERCAIAHHYWALRQDDTEEKRVAGKVADYWDVSVSHVRASAAAYKETVARFAEANGWDRALRYAELIRKTPII